MLSISGPKKIYQLSVCHFQNCDLSFAAQITEGKEICKLFVQRGLGLVSEDMSASRITRRAPLVICITRLVAQKGLHLITHAIKHVEELVSLLPFLLCTHLLLSGCVCWDKHMQHNYNSAKQYRLLSVYHLIVVVTGI